MAARSRPIAGSPRRRSRGSRRSSSMRRAVDRSRAPLPGGDFPHDGVDALVARARGLWPFLDEAQCAAPGARLWHAARPHPRRRARADDLGSSFRRRSDGGRGALPDAPGMGRDRRRRAVAAVQARPASAPGRAGRRSAVSWSGGGAAHADWLRSERDGRLPARHRPGHHLDARHRVRRRARAGRRWRSRNFAQIYPAPGWVEHDPEEIWASDGRDRARGDGEGRRSAPAMSPRIGITNQRETTIVWDRATGKPIHNAIVWQDRRTADACAALRARRARGRRSRRKTGLLLDPYFSATKIAWLLDHVDGARAAARAGPARLRHGRQLPAVAADRRPRARDRRHQCGAHAAARHPHAAQWDASCCELFGVPTALLPRGARLRRRFRRARAGPVRRADPHPRHRRRPAGGDRRAGLLHARHDEIDLRHRLLRAAQHRRRSRSRRATACSPPSPISSTGKRTYALEGAIFIAGAAVQWLRDGAAS